MDYIRIYADFLKRFLAPQKKIKAVLDCSNGTAGIILKNLSAGRRTEKLKTILINQTPDGNFPAHGPNPLKKGAVRGLQSAVIKHKADIGIVFDADADRAFFVDNSGRFINPDAIAKLLIYHLEPKKAVIDIRAGWLVKKLPIANYRLLPSKVGHYFIKKLMRKTKADFAAEYSGHYYFALRTLGKKDFYFDSGILAAIEIINAISKLPYKLSNFIDLLPQYYRSAELNFPAKGEFASGKKIKNKERLIKSIEKKYKPKTTKISRLDGLTMEFPDWWFNLRASNTERLIRLNIEATSKNLLNQRIEEIKKILK